MKKLIAHPAKWPAVVRVISRKLQRFGKIDLLLMSPSIAAFIWAVYVRLGGSINFLISLFIR